MKTTAFDSDRILTEFLSDYLDGDMSRAERRSFEEYLDQNQDEKAFARKALRGKRALSRLASLRKDISKSSVEA
ncbi:MAG TPA: hypothetical protein VJ964_15970 [Balneolaceae bacterium]|nr:hypothetical protein [Balneolaceae bacterium]